MTHRHGGHRGGHRSGGIGFAPIYVVPSYACLEWELGCPPSTVGYDVLFGYGDDIRAIRTYFDQTAAKTAEAAKIKDDFIKWYDTLWITANYVSEKDYDLARNQRNRFNLANAVTPEEKAAVADVIKTGISSEQTQGEPDRRLDSGMLPGPVKPPPPPLIPTSVKVAGAAVAALVVIAAAYGAAK